MFRKIFCAFLTAVATIGTVSSTALAQDFPSRPLRFVVPYPPAGSPDSLARSVAEKVSESVGQSIVIDNRPGAAGVLAAEAVVRAQPDGYTLLLADSSVYAINPNINRKLPFDLSKDLAPVALAATSPIFLVVDPKRNLRSVKDLIALAKSNPGLAYASSGTGTAHHLAMELFKSIAGIDMIHVPYKGASQTVPAVMAGDVVACFSGSNVAMPQAKAGKVNLVAVATGKRSALLPDVPTMDESGVPGFDINISLGFFAPAKTPRPIIDRLNSEIVRAVNSQDVRQRLIALGVEGASSTPDQYAEQIRNELRQYARMVKSAGIRTE